jgi:hypothetical protein
MRTTRWGLVTAMEETSFEASNIAVLVCNLCRRFLQSCCALIAPSWGISLRALPPCMACIKLDTKIILGINGERQHNAMANYVIVAHELNHGKARYFQGYYDYGIVGEVGWVFDSSLAKQIGALEVETEWFLLIMLCPNSRIDKIRVDEYWCPKPA